MKFLIIGSSGLVGSSVSKSAKKSHEAYGTFFSQKRENLYYLDITDKLQIDNLVNKIKPDIIVHSAALANVDYCEEYQEESLKINVEGTKNIAKAGKNINSKVVFISTDYVFDGKNGPYSENDIPDPINFYGKSKLDGENIIKELEDFLIIRTTGVYGIESAGKNFVVRLINENKSGNTVKVPIDQYGNPTYSDNLGEVIVKLIENNKKGIYNVAGTETINRYEFALKIAEVFQLDKKLIKPVETSELNQKADRPLYGGLKINSIKNEIDIKLLSPIESLSIMNYELRRK